MQSSDGENARRRIVVRRVRAHVRRDLAAGPRAGRAEARPVHRTNEAGAAHADGSTLVRTDPGQREERRRAGADHCDRGAVGCQDCDAADGGQFGIGVDVERVGAGKRRSR